MRKRQTWIALAIYLVAFAFWPLDRRDVAGFLTRLLPLTSLGIGLGYLMAAGVVAIGAALMTRAFAAGRSEPTDAAIVICWIGFGLLLNFYGFIFVVIGISVLVSQFSAPGAIDTRHSNLGWKGAILRSAHVWVAVCSLIALATTLRESVFFEFLAGALGVRILSGLLRSPTTATT